MPENPTEEPSTPPEGAPPEGTAVEQKEQTPQQQGEPAEKKDEPLGEKGLKALQAEREARKSLEKQLEKLTPLQKIADALGEGDPDKGKSEIEHLTERLSKHEEELSTERAARYRAEVAHEKGLTAQQAARLVGNTREELTADADALLSLFPTQPAKRFQGTVESGARKGSSRPNQLTRDDLKEMSTDEIAKAQAEGRCDDLLAGK